MATTKLTLEERLVRCKLRALSEGTRIWLLEAGPNPRYASPSTTEVGLAYEVICHSPDSANISCNCKAGQNGLPCKHIGAVLLHLDVSAEMELAQARATEDRERATDITS